MKKFFLIAVIVIIVVVVGVGIYIYVNKDSLANMAMDKAFEGIEQVTLNSLTADYNADSVKTLISKAKAKAQKEGFGSPQLQTLMQDFKNSLDDKKVDSLEVKHIVEDLQAYAGE